MDKHLQIKTDDVEIEKVGDIARVYIKDFGFYEQVGSDYTNFRYKDGKIDTDIAYVINKIVETL